MRRFGVSNENGRTILLVEGNDCLRTLIREYLDSNGFDVKDAADSSEAMRLAGVWGRGKPDLLLAATRLADVSGAVIARKLRDGNSPGMAAVYLVEDELDMDSLLGSDLHVQKPFSFIQLHSAVEDALMEVERKEVGRFAAARDGKGVF